MHLLPITCAVTIFCIHMQEEKKDFHDWLMRLPEEIEENFWAEMRQYEEDKKMEYVTSVKRIGIKKEIQQEILRPVRLAFSH